MKSVLLGILAALIGCAIFFACLVGWYELTGQGSGVFSRRAETEASGAVTASNAAAGVTIVSSGTTSAESSGASSAESSGTSAAESGTDTTVPLVVQPEAETPEHLLEAFAEKIEKELSPTLGDGGHVRVASSSRGITITLWEDDLVSRLSAGQTNGETERLWEEMKDRLRTMTLTYYSRRSEEGVPDAHIVANLLNEERQDDIILSYEDGALIHDGLDHD
ncbi:MAG: hypothetical protein IJQ21_09470 [Lachnospiraceae bacterium]|nr:hypothetical protein [Lachnospiraceae bacterium]